MSFALNTVTRDAQNDAIRTKIDAGAGTSVLELLNSAGVIIWTVNLNATSFGVSAGGAMSLSGIPLEAVVIVTGTISKYRFKDKNGTAIITGVNGSVAIAAGLLVDIILSSVAVEVGDYIRISSLTYTSGNA